MKQYEEIVKECDALIPRDAVAKRDGGSGKKLSYLEGWYVIDRLNKVLGQGNWAYGSEVTLLHSGVIKDRYGNDVNTVHYSAKVRLVVKIAGEPTEFTDYGYGDGSDKTNPGKAHELAIKEAVTDGLKRAARCLGNSFGNGLYDKSGDGIDEGEEVPSSKPAVPQPHRVGGVSGESAKAVPLGSPFNREICLKSISSHSKVALDKKVISQDALVELLKSYGVSKKEELKDEQAADLLGKLREMVKG
jgi:DNA recombination protein Rad52